MAVEGAVAYACCYDPYPTIVFQSIITRRLCSTAKVCEAISVLHCSHILVIIMEYDHVVCMLRHSHFV